MKLANVLPGDTIVVELKYTELLVPPMACTSSSTRRSSDPGASEKRDRQASPQDEFVKAPYTRQGEAPQSEFNLSGVVDRRAAPGAPVSIASGRGSRDGKPGAEVTLDDEQRRSGNRDFILATGYGKEIASGLLLYQGQDENFFLLMAEPPQVVEPGQIPPREHLVDVSGSMHGFPLDTAKS